jgi:hypothetical protein
MPNERNGETGEQDPASTVTTQRTSNVELVQENMLIDVQAETEAADVGDIDMETQTTAEASSVA